MSETIIRNAGDTAQDDACVGTRTHLTPLARKVLRENIMSYRRSYRNFQRQVERPAPKPSFWTQFQIVADEGASCPIDLRAPSTEHKQVGAGDYNEREGTSFVYAFEARGALFVRCATTFGWEWSPATRVS
jgi:hypothetical protein